MVLVDLHFDHYILEDDKKHLSSIVSYYKTVDTQPSPYCYVLPFLFSLGFLHALHVVQSFRTWNDMGTLAALVTCAVIFGLVIIPSRSSLSIESNHQLQLKFAKNIAIGHLFIGIMAFLASVLQFKASSKMKQK